MAKDGGEINGKLTSHTHVLDCVVFVETLDFLRELVNGVALTENGEEHLVDDFVLHRLRLAIVTVRLLANVDVEFRNDCALEPLSPTERLSVWTDWIGESRVWMFGVILLDVRVHVEIEVLIVSKVVAQP